MFIFETIRLNAFIDQMHYYLDRRVTIVGDPPPGFGEYVGYLEVTEQKTGKIVARVPFSYDAPSVDIAFERYGAEATKATKVMEAEAARPKIVGPNGKPFAGKNFPRFNGG